MDDIFSSRLMYCGFLLHRLYDTESDSKQEYSKVENIRTIPCLQKLATSYFPDSLYILRVKVILQDTEIDYLVVSTAFYKTVVRAFDSQKPPVSEQFLSFLETNLQLLYHLHFMITLTKIR